MGRDRGIDLGAAKRLQAAVEIAAHVLVGDPHRALAVHHIAPAGIARLDLQSPAPGAPHRSRSGFAPQFTFTLSALANPITAR